MSIETPAALFALSDFAEHTDGSGEAWAAFQEVDAHITALQAEVERLTKLAYLGEHHFPDLTYKARLEELVPQHRALEAEIARLQARERELEVALSQASFALHSTHTFMLHYCGETNPETGEIIDADALPTWNLVCAALDAVSAETEDDHE